MFPFAGACRFVFNRALAFEQKIYALCGFRPGYAELSEVLARSKKEPDLPIRPSNDEELFAESLGPIRGDG